MPDQKGAVELWPEMSRGGREPEGWRQETEGSVGPRRASLWKRGGK